jgi:outer membrane protein assembly factor BamB
MALAQPTVTVGPKVGPPTEKVAASGTGFASNEAVDLYFDTADLALATTGPGGSFSGIHLTVPASALPGEHWITGVGRSSGLAAQTPFLVRTDWPQFLGGPKHHGYNSTENVLNASNVAGLQLLWKASTQGDNSSPVLANGVIYVESLLRYLYAFDAVTGKQLWMVSAGDSSNNYAATPAVAHGVVYAVANDGLFALDAATGRTLWHTFSGAGTGGLTVANGVVYVDAGDFYAVNAATGQQLWSAPIGSYFQAMAAVANGVVYKGGLDGFMYAFDAATGQQIWQSAYTLGSMGGAADVANGVVYEQSYNTFFAFDAASGRTLWTAPLAIMFNAQVSSSPAVANGVVYEGPFAFNAITGQLLWTAPIVGYVLSTAAVANGVVYLAEGNGGSSHLRVHALDALTGQILWTAVTDYAVQSALAVANGVLYVTSPDSVYAFGLPPAQPPARPNPATLQRDLTLYPQR